MQKAEVVFLLLLAAFLIGFCLIGQVHYGYSLVLMRFPLLTTGFVLVVIVLHLRAGLGSRAAAEPAAAAQEEPGSRPAFAAVTVAAIPALLCLLSVVPLLVLLGYPLGFAAYLTGTLRQAGEGWPLALSIGGGSLLLSYGLFVKLLGVSLPLLPFWWS